MVATRSPWLDNAKMLVMLCVIIEDICLLEL